MKRESTGSLLSTVFVDYDNIYLSLKRKNEEAAKRFAKNANVWINAIASGELITPTNGMPLTTPRRIVMNRCYGNPVPRRNNKDNSTDMNSFPFVRHHYLRAGFEVIDCPPLTAQLKNSADIRMVMDVRDYLLHDTYFDEFIILSGDADFTPVLHRLRAHARRTVIYANDYTAAPYRAISDGEIRESDMISLLVNGGVATVSDETTQPVNKGLPSPDLLTQTRSAIINEVLETVRSAPKPVPLEALADRAVRVLGHDKTVGTAWGGAGSFRDLLSGGLPQDIQLSDSAPYYVVDLVQHQQSLPNVETNPAQQEPARQQMPDAPLAPASQGATPSPAGSPQTHTTPDGPSFSADRSATQQPSEQTAAPHAPAVKPDLSEHRFAASNEPELPQHAPQREVAPAPTQPAQRAPVTQTQDQPHAARPAKTHPAQATQTSPATPQKAPAAPAGDQASTIQQSIARIHEACQAPPLSPPEYKVLFEVMAHEIKSNGLTGARTLVNIVQGTQEFGVNLRRDDARFILEVISEADPWFEHGASANLFASRFRNFVVARCRSQGMNLSAGELDLIDAWFAGNSQSDHATPAPTRGVNPQNSQGPGAQAPAQAQAQAGYPAGSARSVQPQPNRRPNQQAPSGSFDPFGGVNTGQQAAQSSQIMADDDELPRIIRTRARG